MPDKNFKDAPVTVGELRVEKTQDSKAWNMRDMLVSALRAVDNGEAGTAQAILVYQDQDGTVNFQMCGSGRVNVALMEQVKYLLFSES